MTKRLLAITQWKLQHDSVNWGCLVPKTPVHHRDDLQGCRGQKAASLDLSWGSGKVIVDAEKPQQSVLSCVRAWDRNWRGMAL